MGTTRKKPAAKPTPTTSEKGDDVFARWSRGEVLDEADLRAVAAHAVGLFGERFEASKELAGTARRPVVRHRATGYELVLVPGGKFTMGLTEDDVATANRWLKKTNPNLAKWFKAMAPKMRPAHEVTVAPFAVGRRALSKAQAVALTGKKDTYDTFSPAEADALAALAGGRLPSESEWEFLAREGVGKTFVHDVADAYLGDAGEVEETRDGVFDFAVGGGTWTADAWHESYEGAPANGEAWLSDDAEAPRVFRGAFSFSEMQSDFELVFGLSAFRSHESDEGQDVGVRLAISLDGVAVASR